MSITDVFCLFGNDFYVHLEVRIKFHSYTVISVFPVSFADEAVLFPKCTFGFFVKNQVAILDKTYNCALYFKDVFLKITKIV